MNGSHCHFSNQLIMILSRYFEVLQFTALLVLDCCLYIFYANGFELRASPDRPMVKLIDENVIGPSVFTFCSVDICKPPKSIKEKIWIG